MSFPYKKTQYQNIYTWAKDSQMNCFYCNDEEKSSIALEVFSGKGICQSCLDSFEVGHLAADRHVIERISPQFKTEEEAVQWFSRYGEMESVGEGRYHFLNDPVSYREYLELLSETDGPTPMDDRMKELMESFTPVEIDSDGNVHIIY